jgi:hypothetical protein
MNHSRLLVLLHCDTPPDWFREAVKVMDADRLWKEIREGFDPADQKRAQAVFDPTGDGAAVHLLKQSETDGQRA